MSMTSHILTAASCGCLLRLLVGNASATEDLRSIPSEDLIRAVQQAAAERPTDPDAAEARINKMQAKLDELARRGQTLKQKASSFDKDINPLPALADPSIKLPPQNSISVGALPPNLAWGDHYDGWKVGLAAHVIEADSMSQVSVVIALANHNERDRYYLTSGSSHPFDVFIVSDTGVSGTLGIEMKLHFRFWERLRGRIVASNTAEIIRLQFPLEELTNFTGDCVLYARGHIPGGSHQQHVEPLSGNVTVSLPGTSIPSSASSGSAQISPHNSTSHNRGDGDVQTAISRPALGNTGLAVLDSPKSWKARHYGWVFTAIVLFALAGGILLRAVLRSRTTSNGNGCG